MKKVILLLCITLFSLAGHSQVTWDARAGVNLSGFSKGDFQWKWGFKAGAGVEYAFTDLFALRPALYFSTKGATISDKKFGFNPDRTFKLSYLEMPVLATFRFPVVSGFSIGVNAGPYFACRVSKKWMLDTAEARRFDTGVNAGIDFLLNKFVIGVEAQYGLLRLNNLSGAPHNVNYSLTFGYRLQR